MKTLNFDVADALEIVEMMRMEMIIGTELFSPQTKERLWRGRDVMACIVENEGIVAHFPEGRVVNGEVLTPLVYIHFRGGIRLENPEW